MRSFLLDIEEVNQLIAKGRLLVLAGDDVVLSKLSSGNWIAGTIPYFMDSFGGVKSKNKIFVIDLTDFAEDFKIISYDIKQISSLGLNYFDYGFNYIIIPSFSEMHKFYSENCYDFKNIFNSPLIGWVSGFDLEDKNCFKGKTYNGFINDVNDTNAVILHVKLKDSFAMNFGNLNLFEPGNGDIIQFFETGFKITDCMINEKKVSLAKYLTENEMDTCLPLVTYFQETKVNVSFKAVNVEENFVEFYAPVFPGIDYQFATPVGLYEQEFEEVVAQRNIVPLVSCNCILNYLYASLEGKKTGKISGPITFGEIFYVLLNQTMVYLEISEKI